jgi:hypothetical protein
MSPSSTAFSSTDLACAFDVAHRGARRSRGERRGWPMVHARLTAGGAVALASRSQALRRAPVPSLARRPGGFRVFGAAGALWASVPIE